MARDASVLSCYVLPGPALDPLPVIEQTTAAERLGLGAVWISELQGPMKDAGAICGYMGHCTSTIRLGTSVTHFGTRHPMVLASWGATMQALTGGRFALGFGRSASYRWRKWGVPVPTIESMSDYVKILRQLWAHETVSYDGPAGRFPTLNLGDSSLGAIPDFDPPPLMLAAIGPNTLEASGRSFDGVFLHPSLTTDGVASSRQIVHDAAKRAGRDPHEVKIFSELVVAPDGSEADVDLIVRGRMAAYFSGPSGEMVVKANGWDRSPIDALRTAIDHAVQKNESAPAPLRGRELLVEPSRVLPEHWIRSSTAIGTPRECARRVHEYLDAGADEVLLHGTTPDGLGETVRAFTSV